MIFLHIMTDHLSGPDITTGLKRHSPILPTASGCNFERPESSKGRPQNITQINFAATSGRQDQRTALHSSKDLVVAPFRLP